MSPEFIASLIQVTLNLMFKRDGYFDISALQTLWRLVGITPEAHTLDGLRLLHCKHWRDLPPALREQTAAEVARTFGWRRSEARPTDYSWHSGAFPDEATRQVTKRLSPLAMLQQ
jgi:hypothetical protein